MWHGTRLAAYAPRKSEKFPPLKDFLHDAEAPKRRQTVAEQISAAMAWTAALKPRK